MPRFAASLAGLLAALLVAAAPTGDIPTERWVVGFSDDRLPADIEDVLLAAGALDGVALHSIGAVAVTLPADGAERLREDPRVVGMRPERRLQMHLASSVPFIGAGREQLSSAATIETAGGPVERPVVDGTGQTVAVVDTGVWTQHPDLSDRVVASLDFELAYAGELLLTPEELDTFAETTGPLAGTTDDVGHGTHVAGIVAGTGAAAAGRENDNRGVAPGAAIVDLRISPQAHTTDNNVGWERNALAAYDWLVRHHADASFGEHGIRVVNNSWGVGPGTLDGEPLDYSPFDELLGTLFDEDVVVVFSAGNSGPEDDVTEELLPTGHPTVITVAAGCHPTSASNGCRPGRPDAAIASFSSHGPAVDVTAPGVDVISAVNVSSGKALGYLGGDFSGSGPADEAVNRAWYANFSGTSMSGPHIAGVVALLLEADPTLTPTDVRLILGATARDLLEAGRDIGSGWGMVDVPAALAAAVRHAAGTAVTDQFPDHDSATGLGS